MNKYNHAVPSADTLPIVVAKDGPRIDSHIVADLLDFLPAAYGFTAAEVSHA